MRLAYFCLAMACALAVLTPAVHSQTMLEYGVSATGGSTMGVAGKGVSDGINSIFRRLDQQTKGAAATSERRLQVVERKPDNVTDSSEPVPTTSSKQTLSGTRATTTPSISEIVRQSNLATISNAGDSRPEPPALTSEDLAAVESGQARDEVVARLGAPAARVIIPDGGHLQEVYLYNSRRTHLGKVVLVDGAVSAVNVQ